MFIVCVTDTQPKECKGVLKRLMDVVTVDYGEPLTGFVMKENEGCERKIMFLTARIHLLNLKYNLIYRLCIVKEPLNVSPLQTFCFCFCNNNFLSTPGWKKSLKAVES